jgi:competence protein ComFC
MQYYPATQLKRSFTVVLDIEQATAGYYFSKSSVLQRLIHQLKYNGNIEVGHQLGQWLGLQTEKKQSL